MNLKFVCGRLILVVFLSVSCTTPMEDSPALSTEEPLSEATLEILATKVVSEIATLQPTITAQPIATLPVPIGPDNLDQLKFLHEYWPRIGTAAIHYVHDDYKEQWVYGSPGVAAIAISYSPDGRYIAVGGCTSPGYYGGESNRSWCGRSPDMSQDENVKPLGFVVDALTEEIIAMLPEYGEYATITDLAFTHDGKKLLIATDQFDTDGPGKLEVWDVASQQVETVLWQDGSYPSISISRDDRWVAIDEYRFDKLTVLDLSSGEITLEVPLEPKDSHFRPVTPFTQFSADGRQLASHDYLNGIAVYDTATWEQTAYFTLPCEEICFFRPSPDLTMVATSTHIEEQAPVLIWDIKTGEQIQTLPGNEGRTKFLRFTPDGKMFLRVSDDGIISAWRTADWQFVGNHNIFPDEIFFDFLPVNLQFADDGRSFLLESESNLFVIGLP